MSSLSSKQDTSLMSLGGYVESLYIPYAEIESATNNFADENLISQNTYNKVYKGQLSHSGELIDIVARKCLQKTIEMNEIMMSKNLKHDKIVSIFKIGWNGDVIINKHEANGSLDKHLSGSTLTWIQRLHICVCIADALRYIHNLEDDECVIHGNIKCSHILLDQDWEPKLKGFGFAIVGKKHHLHLTSEYKGSIEYMDPEYERTGGLTKKSDVFSFGVVLFEVLFGRKAEGENWYFARLARSHYEAGTLDAMINSDIRKQMDEHSLKILTDTAYVCLKEGRALRPDMDHIFKKLQETLQHQQIHESYVRSSNHLKGKNMDHLRIPLSDIEFATNNFSTNFIGSGGFGTVYKAELNIFDDTISSTPERKYKVDFPKRPRTVAVKRLEKKQGEVAGFFTEIEMLTNCKHPNVVSLLGFCEEGPERILVYEHVSNGSVSDYFEKNNYMKRLSWAQRLQICLDVAHGLNYLHSDTKEKPMIIHRDIKSDNILLDKNWVAKIADFGLSRLRPANQEASTIQTGTIAGTEVYLDPEYMETGRLKKESDIYSFGVVLFEVLSGKLAYDRSYSIENEKGLLSIVQKCFSERTLKKVIDPNLKEAFDGIFILDDGLDQRSLDTFLDVAYQCLAHTQAERPTMKVIINELEKALNYQVNRKDDFHISLKDINLATKNFSDDKCIGEGRYWKQYEGQIPLASRHTAVIVKRWDKKSSQARHQYFRELNFFQRKHENIVALVGICKESGERIIVYEHASNGRLDKHLDDMNLTWIKRVKICVGITTGLKYLHEGAGMIHRDIKSSSILLDSDWEPKICNFELSSKSMERLKVEHATDNAYGSLGYLDPLHEEKGYLDKDSDIYSLGVILMEILCGRLAWEEGCTDHSQSLGPLATRLSYSKDKLHELVFEGIKEQFDSKSFTIFKCIATGCLEKQSYLRPKASLVVTQLRKALEIQERYEKLPITLEDIKLGTENFSDGKFIGEGRYWKQYKGDIPHANGVTTLVVKRFDTECDEGSAQFRVEYEALFECKHENVIRAAGYFDEMNDKIIVYEHASNGRLSEHLKDTSLTWLKRLRICIDVATGLEYLHGYEKEDDEDDVMIHTDIKSRSILIDGEWKAIISNLELLECVSRSRDKILYKYKEGKESESPETEEQKKKVLEKIYAYDSFDYIDPNCRDRDDMTSGVDIYSLGVVLLEILCGRLAWEEECKDPSESLSLLAKRQHKEGNLDELVFVGIKNQIYEKSLTTFIDIAIRCLDILLERPRIRGVIIALQKALEYQEDYETWEPKLPRDYKEILHYPKLDELEKFKDVYDTLCKGFHFRDREVYFSLGINGAKKYVISAEKFSYKYRWALNWQHIPQSRFRKVAKMLSISNLNIHIKMRTSCLNLDAKYAVNLIFKFCDPQKSSSESVYVNLTYKMGRETFHAYFSTLRDEDWMKIELCHFLNHKEDTNFEVLILGFSRSYCGSDSILVEGIEFLAINNLKHDDNKKTMDIRQQLPTDGDKRPENEYEGRKLLSLSKVNKKKHVMISAMESLYNSSNVDHFQLNPSDESRKKKLQSQGALELDFTTSYKLGMGYFWEALNVHELSQVAPPAHAHIWPWSCRFQGMIELPPQQVIGIKCKIESQRLSPDTDYMCYLVFKLSEKCHGLHCPVRVRNVLDWKNKEIGLACFRPPNKWDSHDTYWVPRKREDGWMEVRVWKFNSTSVLRNDRIPMHLKLITYEGTMSGLIVCGLEIRPM